MHQWSPSPHGNISGPLWRPILKQRGTFRRLKMEANIEKKFQKSYFDVLGLCCTSEVPLIEKILNSLDGVKDFSVIVPTKTVIVVHDSLITSQITIEEYIHTYKWEWVKLAIANLKRLKIANFFKHIFFSHFVKALNQARLEANIRAHGETKYKNKWPSPYAVVCGLLLLLSFLKYFYSPLRWLAIGAIVVGIVPVLLKAFAAATAVMSSLVSVVPQRAVLADTGEEINADEVKLNTIVAVKAGEVIPIDGIVVEGNCEVDEKFLTGESFPVAKQKESTVWASTINLNAIVVISASLALVPVAFRVHNKNEWYHLSLVVLVSGCPCALLLSTPVAMFCALSKAARLGVLFKGAEHLETLARIKIMAFDKTGTITRGEFLVADFRSLQDNISLNTLLYWISSIESKSSHPMAAALVDFARAHAIQPKPEKVERFEIFPGEGICGRIEGNDVYVGNWKIASRAGCTVGFDVQGKSIGYVFLGSSPAGIFCLSDACRTGAKEALTELKSMGIKTVMLTGDCYAAAKHAQDQLGGALDVVHAQLLPQDKERIIKELQKEGPTAMIGDGVDDAPALATADIGISMGVSGSALATETGDIILMSNDIQRIPKASRIAKKVRQKIIENVIISISTKAAILGLAIAGHPLVWAAVLTDVGTCLLVIFNSMLILRGIPRQGKKCCRSTTSSHTHFHKHKKCNKTSSGCSSNSCSDVESQKKCELKSCSSSKKCATKCGSSSKEPSSKAHCHTHNHGCSENSSGCKSIATENGPHETIQKQKCEHGNQSDEQVMHKHHCMENHPVNPGKDDSPRKECCNRNGHLETSFGGGLSKIVIE
ncbi:hypothetical protein DH2020_034558 [Rehmannia glutinosa]|uniref:HMA domain-containing protein n=1 Tax=Rehmannia glutinosa TaxID=99300 RepID=A0ABR0V9H2_REHGL